VADPVSETGKTVLIRVDQDQLETVVPKVRVIALSSSAIS
jgi:hypothetical protein